MKTIIKHSNKKDTIYGEPTSGTYADYILLKEDYKKLDKTLDYKYRCEIHSSFLKSEYKKTKNLICSYCGKEHLVIETKTNKVSEMIRASVDHFIAQYNGGSKFNSDNFVVSCQKCNSIKGSKEYSLDKLKYISKERFEIVKKYYLKYKK